jgi:hypothetical protein
LLTNCILKSDIEGEIRVKGKQKAEEVDEEDISSY